MGPMKVRSAQRGGLPGQVARWVDRGLISREQGERILAEEEAEPPPGTGRTASLVTEGLGYIGGVLVLVAAATITSRYWSDIDLAGRLSVAFGAAAVLLLAGAVLPDRDGAARRRLRAVCWLLAVVMVGTGLALVGEDMADFSGDAVTLLAFGGSAPLALGLWWRHRGALQHAAVVVTLAGTAGAASSLLPAADEPVTGLAVWGFGAAWLLLAVGGAHEERTTAVVLGGAVAVVGALLTISEDWGSGLALASAAALVVSGVWLRDLVLLVVGAAGTLLVVPSVLAQYFPDTLTASLVLLATGVLLVAAAVATARWRRRESPQRSRPTVRTRPPLALAAVVIIGATAAVLALGLG